MLHKKRIAKKEYHLQKEALKMSEYIHLKRGVNTEPDFRKASKEERETIFKIAYGALLALNFGENCGLPERAENAIIDTAEFTLENFISDCNAFLTIRIPLKSAIEKWRKQS